jgi:phage terminase small subunit
MGLNHRRQTFCEEYLKDLNGHQSAVRAGYSKHTASVQAARLLAEPEVKTYIQELRNEVKKRNLIDVDELVQILANVARCDIAEYYDTEGNLKDMEDIPKEHRAALDSIDVSDIFEGRNKIGVTKRVRFVNRLTAIELLMKHLGAFEKDNTQQATNVTLFKLPENGRD